MDLYLLRESNEPGTYIITKFDNHMNVVSSYLMSQSECACPQGTRPQCRHRKMLPYFKKAKHIGDGWFLNYDTRQWVEPVLDDIDSHTAAPTVAEPEAEILPPASAPATARPSPATVGAPRPKSLFVRPL